MGRERERGHFYIIAFSLEYLPRSANFIWGSFNSKGVWSCGPDQGSMKHLRWDCESWAKNEIWNNIRKDYRCWKLKNYFPSFRSHDWLCFLYKIWNALNFQTINFKIQGLNLWNKNRCFPVLFLPGTWEEVVKDVEVMFCFFVFFFDLASEMERVEKEWTDSVGQNQFAGLVLIAEDGFHNYGSLPEYARLLRTGEIQLTKV